MKFSRLFKSSADKSSAINDTNEIVDKIAESSPRINDSYNVILKTEKLSNSNNSEEVTWKATASYGSFEVIGVGKTLLKAKRNLHGQLKRMERFSRIASVLIGVRLGIYSCKVERKKEDGEISEEG